MFETTLSRRQVTGTSIVAACLLIASREFRYFISPRLWAEEATIYFDDALHSGWQIFLHADLGYYSFYNKLASYLATFVPIHYAPFVFLTFSLLAMLSVYFYIVQLVLEKVISPYLIVPLFLLLTYLPSYEIWLNVITSQFWLALSAVLILFLKPNKSWADWTVLSISCLTGPLCLFYLPAAFANDFLSKYRQTGYVSQAFRKQFAALSLETKLIAILFSMQLLAVAGILPNYHEVIAEYQGGERFQSFDLLAAVKGLVGYYLMYPFLGISLYDHHKMAYYLTAILTLSALTAIAYIGWRNKSSYTGLMVTSLFMSICTVLGSVGGAGGLRYAFILNIVILLYIAHIIANFGIGTLPGIIGIALLSLSFVTILIDQQARKTPFFDENWPSWQQQLVTTPCDKDIEVWPITGNKLWTLTIKSRCDES